LEWVQETGDCSTTERTGAAQIGSSSYADSIYFECRPSRFKILEFDVAGAYQQFETYIGIRSDSPTNSTALFELLDEHDNSLTAPVEIGFGDAEAVTANIAGVLRLKLKISMLTGDNDSAIVWGTPTAGLEQGLLATPEQTSAQQTLRLASLEWVQETGDCSTTERTGAAQIGSSSYADSIYFECRPSRFKILEFDVAGAYQQFETYIGIRSDSPTNSTALFELLDEHDNSLTAPVEIGFGDAEAVTANIAGVLRLKLKISMLTGDNDSAIVWGTPTAVSP
jgi:hypothetical protein